MINENGSEMNKIEYVFLRTKPCILGKEVLDFSTLDRGQKWRDQ